MPAMLFSAYAFDRVMPVVKTPWWWVVHEPWSLDPAMDAEPAMEEKGGDDVDGAAIHVELELQQPDEKWQVPGMGTVGPSAVPDMVIKL